MLELDSLVDGVAAVAYGPPESAAATRCASETASGVLLGGGLGGGVGAGVSFWLVGEQEQNMVLGVLGSTLGMGSEAAGCPSDGSSDGSEAVSPLRGSHGQWCGEWGQKSRQQL